MMYATENEFIKDFAVRTQRNYDMMKNAGYYEVTQLINSAVGLLIIPEQRLYDKIIDGLVSDELYQELCKSIITNTYLDKDKNSLQQIARHIRNSIAHARMEFSAERPPKKGTSLIIRTVTFTDFSSKKQKFKIALPIPLLEKFFSEFSNAIIKSDLTE